MASCRATERHRMKKIKISPSVTCKITPIPVTILDASLQLGYYSIYRSVLRQLLQKRYTFYYTLFWYFVLFVWIPDGFTQNSIQLRNTLITSACSSEINLLRKAGKSEVCGVVQEMIIPLKLQLPNSHMSVSISLVIFHRSQNNSVQLKC